MQDARLAATWAPSTRCHNGPCTEIGEGGCPPIDVGNGVTTESAPNIWRWRTAVEHYVGIDFKSAVDDPSRIAITRFSKLKRWGMDVAKRRGSKRAKVALARKIGVILHRMWIDGTTYRWAEAKPIAAQA